MLNWARLSAGMDLSETAKRLQVKVNKLKSWETGSDAPTIVQLRKAASVYKLPFSSFYLPKPPEIFKPPTHDYRCLLDHDLEEMSPDLTFEIRSSMERRDICMELYGEQSARPPAFKKKTSQKEDPEEVGSKIRSYLGISIKEQQKWRDPRVAFNYWRDALEKKGVLVFQATKIATTEMRGYSIADFPLPVIAVNRRDAYTARIFSMIHELTHIMLKSSSLCDMNVSSEISPQEQKTEAFCNHVASAALVPKVRLFNDPIVKQLHGPYWEKGVLDDLSRDYSVSSDVILSRLLTLGLTSADFCREQREPYLRRYGHVRKLRGHVFPVTDVISANGRTFTRLVLEALYNGSITTSDASDFFGIRTKHFDRLSMALNRKT